MTTIASIEGAVNAVPWDCTYNDRMRDRNVLNGRKKVEHKRKG